MLLQGLAVEHRADALNPEEHLAELAIELTTLSCSEAAPLSNGAAGERVRTGNARRAGTICGRRANGQGEDSAIRSRLNATSTYRDGPNGSGIGSVNVGVNVGVMDCRE